ncbi:MAG: hypothetical protein AAGI54_05360 [Planctomycetota bacterium]
MTRLMLAFIALLCLSTGCELLYDRKVTLEATAMNAEPLIEVDTSRLPPDSFEVTYDRGRSEGLSNRSTGYRFKVPVRIEIVPLPISLWDAPPNIGWHPDMSRDLPPTTAETAAD